MELHLLLGFLLVQVILIGSWQHLRLFFECNESKSASNGDSERFNEIFILPTNNNDEEQNYHGVIPRAFPRWYGPLPCGKANSTHWWRTEVQRAPTKEGWLFVKEMKTGSSTVGGVVLRIARNIARQRSQKAMCNFRIDHSAARNMEYKHRIRRKSFLFTFIRDPAKRYVSEFFHFQVSREKLEPHDHTLQEFFLKKKYLHDYYLRDLVLVNKQNKTAVEFWRGLVGKYSPEDQNPKDVKAIRIRTANAILGDYDFVGITERFDESLVVMQLLLGLKTFDMLYLTAKGSGGYDDGAFQARCTYIVPSFVSPGMKKFFNSPAYHKRSMGDQWLYRAANKSLDLTIDGLGQDLFQTRLKQFKAARSFVQEQCGSKIVFPCSAAGERAGFTNPKTSSHTDCLWLDSGCGANCIDALEDEIGALVGTIST